MSLTLCAAFAVALGLSTPQTASMMVKASAPTRVLQLDAGSLKGRPSRLAWSPDGVQLYLQVVDGDTLASLVVRHYLMASDGSGRPSKIDTEPLWASQYWKWKSAKRFFKDPVLVIRADSRQEVLDGLNGTSATRASFLSDGISGSALALSKSTGTRTVNLLMLNGEVLGEFIDEAIVPGFTFSWSPEELRMVAFSARSGRLVIMDGEGHKQEIADSRNTELPAWSEDGDRIAYLERLGRKKYALNLIDVSGR